MPLLLATRPSSADFETDAGWSELVDALTRREVVIGTGLAGVAALAGCGRDEPTANPAGRRAVATAKGPVEVPNRPRRVVCLDNFSSHALVEAGLTPIGIATAPDPTVDRPAFVAAARNVPSVTTEGLQPDLERIAALTPDLILGITTVDDATYRRLTAIAPSVLHDYDVPNAWAVLADKFVVAVNRVDAEKRVKSAYERSAADIRRTFADVLATTTFDVAIGGPDHWRLYHANSNAGKMLTDAGIRLGAGATGHGDTGNGITQLSFEQLDRIATSQVLIGYGNNKGEPAKLMHPLVDQVMWKQLRAVKSGRVYFSPEVIPACYSDAASFLAAVSSILQSIDKQGG